MDISRLALDPDDTRPRWQAMASAIKAAIRADQVEPGAQLPSKAELGTHFGVSSTTVTKALDHLRAEGVIITRQGAGAYVREARASSTGLRPHVERLFDEGPGIDLSFAGITAQTLSLAMGEPLAKVRSGRYELSHIRARVLLPDYDKPWANQTLPDGSDDPRIRERNRDISAQWLPGLAASIHELGELGIVPEASIEVRAYGGPPTVKTYLVNDDLFIGFYRTEQRAVKLGRGKPVDIIDLSGSDTDLVHFEPVGGTNDADSVMVDQARAWFDSVWSLATEVGGDDD